MWCFITGIKIMKKIPVVALRIGALVVLLRQHHPLADPLNPLAKR